MDNYYRYWGKTNKANPNEYHLLPYHSLDVAACLYVLLDKNQLLKNRVASLLDMCQEDVHIWLTQLAMLHDVGKFSKNFQSQSPKTFQLLNGTNSTKSYDIYHDTLGFIFWHEYLHKRMFAEDQWSMKTIGHESEEIKDILRPLMNSVMGHHGAPPKSGQSAYNQFSDCNIKVAVEFSKDALSLFRVIELPFSPKNYEVNLENAQNASWFIAGLLVFADWLGSNHNFFPFQKNKIPLEKYWREFALPQAQKAIVETGFLVPNVATETGVKALFGFDNPTPMQDYVTNCEIIDEPQLIIIEDLTGSGKTEAVTILAHRLIQKGLAEGFYFGLPTMATADQMFDRMCETYFHLYEGDVAITLAHSAARRSERFLSLLENIKLTDDLISPHQEENRATAQCTTWLSDMRKKALLSPIGIGTIDQALMATIPVRHQSLRVLGLSRNVLIVDEVHAYDAYMQTLLENLIRLQSLNGGSVILLSATIPQEMREKLCKAFSVTPLLQLKNNAFPLITQLTKLGKNLQEVAIPATQNKSTVLQFYYTEETVFQHISALSQQGKCVCWIRNTVDDAIDAWQKLGGEKNPDLFLFHARFAFIDRQKRQEEILSYFDRNSTAENRKSKILIATQVVEQSLDLDFDTMITDLAPMDLLIQRAGRIMRHKRDVSGNPLQSEPKIEQRGIPQMGILCPEFSLSPPSNWYSPMHYKGAYIYKNVGQLWLTLKILQEKMVLSLPNDSRMLIESVYSKEAQLEIPESLVPKTQKATKELRENSNFAINKSLNLNAGYGGGASSSLWESDEHATTRIGLPQTRIRLAKWEKDIIRPWAEDSAHKWYNSEVSVGAYKVKSAPRYNIEIENQIEEVKKEMPDKGAWSILIVLEFDLKLKEWASHVINEKGETLSIYYNPIIGLHF